MLKHCFVCDCLIDESSFETTKRDGRDICSEACLEEYYDLSDAEFEKLKKKYEDN